MKWRWHADTWVPHLGEVDPVALEARGIAGAIVDLDNTLVEHGAPDVHATAMAWLARMHNAGLRIVILTNNKRPWAREIADHLGVPCVVGHKPLPGGFRRALALIGLPRDRVVVIGDQYFTDVLGAKLSAIHVILVPPLHPGDPWRTRLLRRFARLLRVERKRMRGKPGD
jgi:HAD superfamily phosphatase (TIGR01668 family)